MALPSKYILKLMIYHIYHYHIVQITVTSGLTYYKGLLFASSFAPLLTVLNRAARLIDLRAEVSAHRPPSTKRGSSLLLNALGHTCPLRSPASGVPHTIPTPPKKLFSHVLRILSGLKDLPSTARFMFPKDCSDSSPGGGGRW